ncbi:MAG TPA: monooxygenase [Bacteroidetes bacterium]|nr:monooxygenase [Bacteroidota bacterium]
MKIQKCDYLILGAGIAGLSVAIALKKAGITALVLESAPAFKPLGAGITLASNAIEVFDRLGIADEVIKEGLAVQRASILSAAGKTISRVSLNKVATKYPQVGIHRGALHQVLLSHVDDQQVLWGKRSTRIEQKADGIRVFLDDGDSLECRWLIVAEGVHSPIRKQLLPHSKVRYAGYTCWRGIAEVSDFKLDGAVEIWGNKGRFGYVGVAPGRVYWFATTNAPEKDPMRAAWKSKELLENYKNYPKEVGELLRATPDQAVLWNDIVDLDPIPHYAFGNVLLLGDAAHATTPNMGQGACQAIEDAWFLAQCLLQEKSPEPAFALFEKLRLQRTHNIVNRSRTLGKIAQWENKTACAIRNYLFSRISEKQTIRQMEKVIRLPD